MNMTLDQAAREVWPDRDIPPNADIAEDMVMEIGTLRLLLASRESQLRELKDTIGRQSAEIQQFIERQNAVIAQLRALLVSAAALLQTVRVRWRVWYLERTKREPNDPMGVGGPTWRQRLMH
jgi:hypothetical protein